VKIRRFVAKDMRSALAQIKDELGVDAVIMSNKKIPEGVELMAAVDYSQVVPNATTTNTEQEAPSNRDVSREVSNDVVSISAQPAMLPQETMVSASTSNKPVDSLSALLGRQVQQPAEQSSTAVNVTAGITDPIAQNIDNTVATTASLDNDDSNIEQQLRNFTERLRHSKPDGTMPAPVNKAASEVGSHCSQEAQQMAEKLSALNNGSNVSSEASISHNDFEKIQQEMASIRQLLEHQVSGLMWQDMAQKDPQRAVLVSRLLALGLNEQLADQIAGYVPAQQHEAQAWQHATQLISEQINTTQNDIIHRGGVVALVGPTGVGKTTTIAKLAARFAQTHGHEQVALISTDTFRIAGFEQLATYGKIIGCQVKLAKDSQALDALLQQFSRKKLVLIDTAGMGQRDLRLAENLASLMSNARVRIRNYLVLAANSQQQVMQENVDRFKKVPLSGCIYTKLDESVSIGEIITTSIQNGLPIGYLTDGQRVPEDIKVANADKLVTLADKMAAKSAKNTSFAKQTVHRMPIAPAAVL